MVRECFRDIRDHCNCALVQRGSPCFVNQRDDCDSGPYDQDEFNQKVRRRYSKYCRHP